MAFVAWLQIVLGVSMAGLWAMLLLTGQVPEVQAGQSDIWFHIAAELTTAVTLIVGGVLVFRRHPRAPVVAALALGMVAYSAIASAGYYAEGGDWAFVAMFAAVLGLTVLAFSRVLRRGTGPRQPGTSGPRTTRMDQPIVDKASSP